MGQRLALPDFGSAIVSYRGTDRRNFFKKRP
jgi:hypothetical protein